MINNFWQNRKVLITGANGFLSSWMTRDLLDKGAFVVALIYAKNPLSIFELEKLDERAETVYGDIRNFEFLKKIIKQYEIETVFHVGAQAICSVAENDPMETLDINIRGTYNVLEAVRQVSPKTHVIVASSDKAYGTHKNLPYKEDFHLCGEYPYEVSKTCTDLISQMYFKSFGLPVSIVRCGNLYGGGDAHFSRVIPATIRRLHLGLQPILIGNSTRDFLYIEDAVRGYLMIAEKMVYESLNEKAHANGKIIGEAFNFGTEKPRSIRDVMKLISQKMNCGHLEPTTQDTGSLFIPDQYLSYEKAKKMLDWQPETSFEQGLEKTIDWYREYLNRLKSPLKTLSNLENYQSNLEQIC